MQVYRYTPNLNASKDTKGYRGEISRALSYEGLEASLKLSPVSFMEYWLIMM